MEYVEQRQTRTGSVNVSCPELTAIDLVTYQERAGSITRAATVLAEFADSVDVGKISGLVPFTTVATIQRLGYLLEYVLSRREQADALYQILKLQGAWNSILLSNDRVRRDGAQANRWHVNGNIDIEVDDL